MGMLIAVSPVAGSVTSALLTSDPFCEACAPFMLIRPVGPRTTPGTRGSKLSTCSFRFGMRSTADSPIVFVPDDCFVCILVHADDSAALLKMDLVHERTHQINSAAVRGQPILERGGVR